MKAISRLLLVWMCAGLSPSAGGQASSTVRQSYPNKPIRLILPSSPGAPVDLVARILAPRWSELLGQQIVIDYRAGAAGLIGADLVAKATSDGYTLLFSFSGPLVIVPQLNDSTPYDTFKDFAPVSLAAAAPYVLLVHPHVPAKSVKELVALARSQAGKFNFASGGSGTGIHLASELFNLAAGVKIVHVPYKAAAPAMTALMAGEVNMMFVSLAIALPHIRTDRLRALAVGGEKRFPLFPDLPTVGESGFQFNTSGWYGVVAPRKTPRAVVERLHGTLVRTLNAAQMKELLIENAVEVHGSTPEQFASFLREEMATWGKVIKAAGLKNR